MEVGGSQCSPSKQITFCTREALGEPSKLVAEQIARLQLNQTCLALTAANDAGANISKEINTF